MGQRYRITETASGASFFCEEGQSVLQAMESQHLGCVKVGCRGGGCGLCRVQVHSGRYECGRMSIRHINAQARELGQALACRLLPHSDLAIEFLGLADSQEPAPAPVSPVMTQQQRQEVSK
ncbi:2Fe-2S iron-sulfur cluster-binding protein [Pseudomonas oligotrophica]|uniref:2Fe-2S iron-sulfur cluster-binding protein n=1 Tax=Pseudomonas oligotrophica TaxID=2912055 RepID=UPI001F01C1D1|nr:2Fe-2S iron-sulfur cluster-binding protein [Pseudomonas oligotrophica]MCF7200766.1 2Fe-2S iron-sulfur cluster-binding protein [Pseudomonas oligotrophica]